ncbi:MAG TPA: hypothetical protein VI876_09850 [Dehalococcoidia bacterium]|nr:hypothetical protein [Dehalococcoidia bacterium]
MRRRRKRYARLQAPDLWANLGPGDPGYRLRPGRTGFDPFEQTLEYARVLGILAASALRGRFGYGLAGFVVLLGLLLMQMEHFVLALLLTGLYGIGALVMRVSRWLTRSH